MSRKTTESETSDQRTFSLFIDGGLEPSSGSEQIDVDFPYDGEVWTRVPNGTAEDIDRAVSAADRAFREEWANSPPSRRRAVLNQIAEIFEDHAGELAELETRQNGKLLSEMLAQMQALPEFFRYFAGRVDDLGGRVIDVENKDGRMFNFTRREPLGVVGVITPWNSPIMLSCWKIGPALATGNTLVHKPSEITPVSAVRLAELIQEETDLPGGVYNVVPGDGDTGAALADHDGVDKLAFTGSSSVGRKIARKAGEKLIPVSLELGGKSPNIVFPSARLDNAVNGVIKGIFAATGQTCIAGSRVFVHDDVYDEFTEEFKERASRVKLGNPLDPETQMGPVAFRRQWEKVKSYVELAEEEGAEIAYGGFQPEDLPGDCFIRPTILTGVDNDMRVAREEIFGPVASVIRFSDEEEVLREANDTEYGLAAGVWSEDQRQVHRVARGLNAGTVWVNEYRTVSYSSPFGGYKDSGLGRENGLEVLEEYLQVKSVWMDLSGEVADPFKLGV